MSGGNVHNGKLDANQIKQVIRALAEVQRHGYGRVTVDFDKGRIRFVDRTFSDKAVPTAEWKAAHETE